MTTDDNSPQLTWTEDDEPRSGRFGDVYFSRDDGLAETRAVFLKGCGLPEAWAGRETFTVAELGFGTGLNIVALLDLWRNHRPDGGRLHIFSIEGFPLASAEAARALSTWPEVVEPAQALVAAWPPRTPGFHRVDLPDFHAVLDVAVGDAVWALDDYGFRAVIAPSYADIFFSNCFKNGVLPVVLKPEEVEAIFQGVAGDADKQFTIDLPAQEVRLPCGKVFKFEINPHHKHNLVNGLDEIGLTLQQADSIRAYEAKRRVEAPWLFN